jgi:transglutaminase-like putative cysteine protease
MTLVEAIRRANKAGPPEDSIRLRAACLGTVLVAVAGCASLHEVSTRTAVIAAGLITSGMVFSYRTRGEPPGWVKVLVAAGAIGAFAWFFHSLSGTNVQLLSVENPLTLLLTSVLVVHSFHVPARRDLLFSLAASAGLMAVGGSQAIDLQFGLYVIAWAGFGLWALTEMWTSASGGGRISWFGIGAAVAATATAAAAIFLVLPAPVVSARVNFLSKAGAGGDIGVPGAFAGDAGTPAKLSQPGTPAGPTRVGGFLGFAGSLNTALRGPLGNALVMLVRAQRPSYWVAETFDTWDGQNWSESESSSRPLAQLSPFVLPVPTGDTAVGASDLQTFYVTASSADLVLHAETASELWFPTSKVFYSNDGTIVSPIGLGPGSIYTVDSQVTAPSAEQLRDAPGGTPLPDKMAQSSVQLPHQDARVLALARSVTAHDATTFGKVQSLIAWMGRHTRYSTDIPPLPAGANTVDEFLFGNRVGFCEQISTSLTVLLRSLGIPAREAVGFVPGSYNPITDLYEVHADDAHAWVQVWFPGYGWQSFDPTALVPAANPAPGTTALRDLGSWIRHLPLIPLLVVFVGVLGTAFAIAVGRRRRGRPATWEARVAGRAEHAGRRAGRPRRQAETLVEFAAALDDLTGEGFTEWRALAESVEASHYGGVSPPPEEQRRLEDRARRIHVPRRRNTAPLHAGPTR